MSIVVTCNCGQRLKARDESAGKNLPCPRCKSLVTVPTPRTEDSGLQPYADVTPRKAIPVHCPCGYRFEAWSHLAGMTIACKRCRASVTVPDSAQPIHDDLFGPTATPVTTSTPGLTEVAAPKPFIELDESDVHTGAVFIPSPAPTPKRRTYSRPRPDPFLVRFFSVPDWEDWHGPKGVNFGVRMIWFSAFICIGITLWYLAAGLSMFIVGPAGGVIIAIPAIILSHLYAFGCFIGFVAQFIRVVLDIKNRGHIVVFIMIVVLLFFFVAPVFAYIVGWWFASRTEMLIWTAFLVPWFLWLAALAVVYPFVLAGG